MSKLTSEAVSRLISMRSTAINQLLSIDGVPKDYLSGISLIQIGMSYIEKIKGKEHLVRILRGWADNIEKDRKTNEI